LAVEAAPNGEAMQTVAQWAASHIEGLYFLGKGGILPVTNHCDPMLSMCQMAAIRFNDLMRVA
jgi:hypothetical protein